MDITPGTQIAVEITATPRSQAARKTLLRLLRKDPLIARHQRHQKAKRPSVRSWRRGGRMWHHRMRSKLPVDVSPGQRISLLATLDVIRDLDSVSSYVKIVR